MNKLVIMGLLFFVFLSSCKEKEGDVIADIGNNYREINKHLKDYKMRRIDDPRATEGGGITGYYRDKEVKKIYSEYFGETGRIFSEYYFDDGMLILIIKQEFTYNRPAYYTEEKAKENNDSEWYDDKKNKNGNKSVLFQ